MKIQPLDVVKLLCEDFIVRPISQIIKKIRYRLELGGVNGYEVNGLDGYWGRYASVEKIVELAGELEFSTDKDAEEWFTFYYPDKKSNGKYSHRIGIYPCEAQSMIEVELLPSAAQCGSYFKSVGLDSLSIEISKFDECFADPEENGYRYVEM